MQQLPEPLRPLEAYPQFILWRLMPNKKNPEKIDKVPIDHRTGYPGDPYDPAAQLTAADAIAATAATGDGVGFVFTASDPFFFLDLDGCLAADGQSWSAVALEVLAKLPGAAVEVSQSGSGLHIFGRTAPLSHGCANKPLGLELYTSRRFVALTGTRAIGDAGVDLTANLAAVAAEYFPAGAAGSSVQTSTLDDQWAAACAAGPAPTAAPLADDAELLKRAKRAKSAAATFGGRCCFADLWKADPDPLMALYPTNDGRVYDESKADAALVQHLAFWTGNDCDRIFRLVWLSGLVRDKWYRGDYLQRTILNAAAKQTEFYVERQARQRIEQAAPALGAATPEKVSGYQYLGGDQQIGHFAGCVYVQNMHRVLTPSGALLKSEQFNATFGGYVFELDENGKTTRKAWEAFTESQIVRYPKAEKPCFRPLLPPGAIVVEEDQRVVNTYVPVNTTKAPGDASRFLEHVAKLLPDENDRAILLSYLAACVQHIGVKFQWCPLLQGTPGNGKTLFTECMAHAIGNRYTFVPPAADISNKFNSWLMGRLFIGVEDVYVPEHKAETLEILRGLITGRRQAYQPKGIDQFMGENWANFLLNMNPRDGIRKTKNDRRFAVFFTAQQSADDIVRDGMGGDYFPRLYDWLRDDGGYAIVADYLARYPIPPHLNPATHCHRAPKTSTTDAAVFESLGGIEQEILELVDEGKPGFSGGWISSMALERMMQDKRVGRAIPRNRRREVLQQLGYDWHPALPGGRVSTLMPLEGGKPRLFIRTDHPDRQLTTAAEVVAAYERAQLVEGTRDASSYQPAPPVGPGAGGA